MMTEEYGRMLAKEILEGGYEVTNRDTEFLESVLVSSKLTDAQKKTLEDLEFKYLSE